MQQKKQKDTFKNVKKVGLSKHNILLIATITATKNISQDPNLKNNRSLHWDKEWLQTEKPKKKLHTPVLSATKR